MMCVIVFGCRRESFSINNEKNDDTFMIKTDKTVYSGDEYLTITFSNATGDTVWPDVCCSTPDYRIQEKIGDTWTPPDYCPAMCLPILLKFAPNYVASDTLYIPDKPGHFRYLLRYATSSYSDSTVTNEFDVVRE